MLFYCILLTQLLFFSNFHPEITKNGTENHLFPTYLPCSTSAFSLLITGYHLQPWPFSFPAPRIKVWVLLESSLFPPCPPYLGAIKFCHFRQ